MRIIEFITRRVAAVPIVFSCIVLVAAFFAGISSGVASSLGHLVPNITGVAAAISAEVFGLKGHPYETYESVRTALLNHGLNNTPEGFRPQNFQNYGLISLAIKSAQSADVCGSPLVSVPFNDQGAIEYTEVAFRMFGIDVRSLYYLYFVIVGASVAAYLVSFWRDYIACTALFAAACAIYSFMPGFLSHEGQLLSVANPRFLSTIGIIPLLHISFFAIRGEAPLRWRSIATIVVQAAILGFAYAARSTSSWMVLVLFLIFAFYLARALAPTFRWNQPAFAYSVVQRRGTIVLVALAALIGIDTAGSLLLRPPCETELYSHTVWHNIFMGFYFSPQWKQRFGPLYDNTDSDQLAFAAAKVYIQRHHLPYPTESNIFQRDSRTGDFVPLGSWEAYDQLMRSVVFEFIREHPRFALESFLIHRPLTFLRAMRVFFDLLFSSVPPSAFIMLFIMCFCIALVKPNSSAECSNILQFSVVLAVVMLCFLVSLDSAFLVYSATFLISDQAYLLVAMVVLLLVWALATLFASIRAAQQRRVPRNIRA